jgi:hypothetical protein
MNGSTVCNITDFRDYALIRHAQKDCDRKSTKTEYFGATRQPVYDGVDFAASTFRDDSQLTKDELVQERFRRAVDMGYINLTDVEKQEVFSLKKALLEDQITFSKTQSYVPACMLRSFNVDLTISNQGISSALNIESPSQTVHFRIEDPEIHVFYYHVPGLVKQ